MGVMNHSNHLQQAAARNHVKSYQILHAFHLLYKNKGKLPDSTRVLLLHNNINMLTMYHSQNIL
jgi:hypothetical protein